ncbi:MAG: hypothetical protein AB1640_25905 [bacterium]
MKAFKMSIGSFILLACLVLLGVPAVPADLTPGNVIDKSNWDEARGSLPESILEWVKKGDVLQVGALSYDPGEYVMPCAQASFEANAGRYELGEDGSIVDPKTGTSPEHIDGFPFPKIDLTDPQAGTKIMWNKYCYNYSLQTYLSTVFIKWIGRTTGLEREILLEERFKVIHDRGDAYWKTYWQVSSSGGSPDQKVKVVTPRVMIARTTAWITRP